MRRADDDNLFNDLPVGYRFVPTDEELVHVYLMSKISGRQVPRCPIYDVQLYQFHPQDLAKRYKLDRQIAKSNEWYFFTNRNKKYPNGKRPRRSIGEEKKGVGRWKASGTDITIKIGGKEVASRMSLDYYHSDKRTPWKMHEYVLSSDFAASIPASTQPQSDNMQLDKWVLCKVYNKKYEDENGETSRSNSGAAKRTGESKSSYVYDQCPPPQANQNNLVPQYQEFTNEYNVIVPHIQVSNVPEMQQDDDNVIVPHIQVSNEPEMQQDDNNVIVPHIQVSYVPDMQQDGDNVIVPHIQVSNVPDMQQDDDNVIVPHIQVGNVPDMQQDDDNPLANLAFSPSTPDFESIFDVHDGWK